MIEQCECAYWEEMLGGEQREEHAEAKPGEPEGRLGLITSSVCSEVLKTLIRAQIY